MLILSSISQVNEVIQAAQSILQSPIATAIRFANSMKTLLQYVYGNHPLHTLDVATAMVQHVATDLNGRTHIQYSQVKVTWGDLEPPSLPTAFAVPGGIRFNWTDNAGEGNAYHDDKCILIVYAKKLNRFRFKIAGADRSAESDILNVPDLSGQWVHTWISCKSADGVVSDSVYTGKVLVV